MITMDTLGFIMLRHVNSDIVGNYWKWSYECIRKYYPNSPIMIIDDNSNYEFIDAIFEKNMTKTTVIRSEFPQRGELLPYYYYLKYPLFETAVIIHDSVFINSAIDFSCDNYKILWHFEHDWDQPADEINIIKHLKNPDQLLSFHSDKTKWKGCFGGMSVIKYGYLKSIDDRYSIANMIPHIVTRFNRMSFERVIACLLQSHAPSESLPHLFGNIHKYCRWEVKIYEIDSVKHLPIIKIWSGR
jgi:hypothetical protein